MIQKVIEQWHAHMRGELVNGLDLLLDDDVVFYSPIVYTQQFCLNQCEYYIFLGTFLEIVELNS